MRTDYNYCSIIEYVPRKCSANEEQVRNRNLVYDCKKGKWSSEIKTKFQEQINKLTSSQPTSTFILCSIPASTKEKTRNRYFNFINDLSRNCNVINGYQCIEPINDQESSHVVGKTADPTSNFKFERSLISGKHVILIDDVITRGTTFNRTSDRLIKEGALSVNGIFLAKTINYGTYGDTGIDWLSELQYGDPDAEAEEQHVLDVLTGEYEEYDDFF